MRGKANLFWLVCLLAGSVVLCARASDYRWRAETDPAVAADVRTAPADAAAASAAVRAIATLLAPEAEGEQEDGESMPAVASLAIARPVGGWPPLRPPADYFHYPDLPPRLIRAI